MIKELVSRWDANKETLRAQFKTKRPLYYVDLVRNVVKTIQGEKYRDDVSLDPERIHEIDDGDYQGTLLYVIGAKGYQPRTYYYVFVDYGSCSGCDTLQAIQGWKDDVDEEELDGYMTLALHIVQGIHMIKEEF